MRREVKDCFQLTSADETVCRPVVTSEARRIALLHKLFKCVPFSCSHSSNLKQASFICSIPNTPSFGPTRVLTDGNLHV